MRTSVQDRVGLIRSAFETVLTDALRGREFVAAQIEGLEPGSQEHDNWLNDLPDAMEVVATDCPQSDSSFLKLFLLPTRATIAVFYSAKHRNESSDLLARLRSALDEEVDEWMFENGDAKLARQHRRRPLM